MCFFFFFQAEDGIRDVAVTGVQTCAVPISDPHFVGAQATAAFDHNGGQPYSAGAKVPVENCCGSGTRDSHWRETGFDTEVMTDRESTRLNSRHRYNSYAVFFFEKKKIKQQYEQGTN